MPLPFTEEEHNAVEMEQGMRILIYRQGAGIVAESEVHGFAIRPSEWNPQTTADLPPEFRRADYLQPVRVLYSREDPLAPTEVEAALGDGEKLKDWQAVSRETYSLLTNWPS